MSHACWSNLSETATTTWIWFPFRHSFGRLPYDHNRITNIIVIINPFFYTDKHLVHCIDVKMGFPALWRWLKHGCTYIVSIKNDDALSFYMLQEKTVFVFVHTWGYACTYTSHGHHGSSGKLLLLPLTTGVSRRTLWRSAPVNGTGH